MNFSPTSVFTPENDVINGRQIAFAAAFLLPAAKLLEVPSQLAKYAAGDLLLPAIFHFLLQSLVLLGILYAVSCSEKTLCERLHEALGKGAYIFYILYALYFLFASALPLLDLEKYVYAAFFDSAPTVFSFAYFFFVCAFICTKGIKAIGRCADLCLFLFLLPFLSLIAMSLGESDFTSLLPLFGEKFGHTMSAFTHTTPHFSDAVFLLPLLANYRYKKKDGIKIMAGYWTGAALVLILLAVFFGVYASIAPREHYAFSKIAQYFPALSVLGRIDLIFVYLLSAVLFFYTCIPVQYSTDLFCRVFTHRHRTLTAAILNVLLLGFVFFFNKNYNAFYALIGGKLPFVFWLLADILPLFCLLLPTDRKNPPKNSKKQEKSYAEQA